MIRKLALGLLPFALAVALPALAHEEAKAPEMSPEEKAMMEAYQKAGAVGPQHQWLATMVGSYDLTIKSWNAPGSEPSVEKGTATRKMIFDGRIMVEEVASQMQGQAWVGHGMHGYDNVKGRHWSTWNDSMSTGIMLSDGECDDKGDCTFKGSWPDPVSKATINARMTTTWTDANTELFTMYTSGADGKEMKMMEITYARRH